MQLHESDSKKVKRGAKRDEAPRTVCPAAAAAVVVVVMQDEYNPAALSLYRAKQSKIATRLPEYEPMHCGSTRSSATLAGGVCVLVDRLARRPHDFITGLRVPVYFSKWGGALR